MADDKQAEVKRRQITGTVSEEVIRKMRIKMAYLDVNQSQAIEAALSDWAEKPSETN